MDLRRPLTAAALVLLVSACQSTLKVGSDYSPSEDFSGLSTWDWMPPDKDPKAGLVDDPRIDNNLLEQRIKTAISAELVARGHVRVAAEPDFYVGYHAAVRSQQSVETLNNFYGYGGAWNYDSGPGGTMQVGRSETYVATIDKGSLVIDIVRPKNKQLIWRGYAEDEVDLTADPNKKQRTVNEAVKAILDSFPPDGQ